MCWFLMEAALGDWSAPEWQFGHDCMYARVHHLHIRFAPGGGARLRVWGERGAR